MTNIIIIAIIALILAGSAFYIYKSKKSGQKCIGCPHSGTCGKCTCDHK